MTGRTVSGARVTHSRTDKSAGSCIMTAGTRVMRFWGCAYKRIIMAASTAGCTNRDAGMAGIRCMRRLPGPRMTGGTVGRGRVADGGADNAPLPES